MFITAFTRTRHWILSLNPVHNLAHSFFRIILISSSHLPRRCHKWSLPFWCQSNIMYGLSALMRATCLAHLTLLGLIILIGDEYKLWLFQKRLKWFNDAFFLPFIFLRKMLRWLWIRKNDEGLDLCIIPVIVWRVPSEDEGAPTAETRRSVAKKLFKYFESNSAEQNLL